VAYAAETLSAILTSIQVVDSSYLPLGGTHLSSRRWSFCFKSFGIWSYYNTGTLANLFNSYKSHICRVELQGRFVGFDKILQFSSERANITSKLSLWFAKGVAYVAICCRVQIEITLQFPFHVVSPRCHQNKNFIPCLVPARRRGDYQSSERASFLKVFHTGAHKEE